MKKIYIIFLILGPIVPYFYARSNCFEQYYKIFLKQHAYFNRPLNSKILDKINFINESNLSGFLKAKQIFDLMLEQRLNELSLSQRIKIKNFLCTKVFALEDPFLIQSAYSFENDEIRIALPRKLKSTAVYYSFLAHELEHKITHLLGKNKAGESYEFYVHDIFALSKLLFKEEGNSMAAEWAYLHQLSPQLKQDILQLLPQVSMHREEKEVIKSMLINSSKNKEQYLAINRSKLGRYNLVDSLRQIQANGPALSRMQTKFINSKNIEQLLKQGSWLAIGIGTVSSASFYTFCQLIKDKRQPSISDSIHSFCHELIRR